MKPPEKCRCSGLNCAPEATPPLPDQAKKSARRKVPASEKITKELQAFGFSELQKLRNLIFFETPLGEHNFLPPDVYLPDDKIKIIIDELYSIKDIPDIVALVGDNPLLIRHHGRLLQHCHALREEFKELCAEIAEKRKALRQSALAVVSGPASDSEEEESDTRNDNDKVTQETIPLVLESQHDTGELELEVQEPTSNLKWKINFRYETYPSRHKT